MPAATVANTSNIAVRNSAKPPTLNLAGAQKSPQQRPFDELLDDAKTAQPAHNVNPSATPQTDPTKSSGKPASRKVDRATRKKESPPEPDQANPADSTSSNPSQAVSPDSATTEEADTNAGNPEAADVEKPQHEEAHDDASATALSTGDASALAAASSTTTVTTTVTTTGTAPASPTEDTSLPVKNAQQPADKGAGANAPTESAVSALPSESRAALRSPAAQQTPAETAEAQPQDPAAVSSETEPAKMSDARTVAQDPAAAAAPELKAQSAATEKAKAPATTAPLLGQASPIVDPTVRRDAGSDAGTANDQESESASSGPAELPDLIADLADARTSPSRDEKGNPQTGSDLKSLESLGADAPRIASPAHAAPARVSQPAPMAPEQQFAVDNHQTIVSSVRSTLLPGGGTMQIRLDPPDLGQLQISVSLRDGVMSASFETTNDQATRLLSHSLSELKGVLESQGVSVDRLHVTQAPKSENASSRDQEGSKSQHGGAQDSPARREQERRELLQRMWRKLSEGSDPLDMVA